MSQGMTFHEEGGRVGGEAQLCLLTKTKKAQVLTLCLRRLGGGGHDAQKRVKWLDLGEGV